MERDKPPSKDDSSSLRLRGSIGTDQMLLQAAEEGDINLIKAAIAAGADLNVRNTLHNTPLCAAASAGHLEAVKLLLERGADVQLPGYCDMTALTLAARDGRLAVVQYLLDHDAGVTERQLNDAITVNSMSVNGMPAIGNLLHNARLKAVVPASHGMKEADARMIAAAERGDAQEVETALKAGANTRASDTRGMDALSWAALRGHDAIVKMLLDHGADINALNSSGWPPIGQACGQGHLAVVQALIARGVDVDLAFDGGRTALMCAAYQGYIEIVKALIQAGANKAVEFKGMTALDLATQQCHQEIAEILKD